MPNWLFSVLIAAFVSLMLAALVAEVVGARHVDPPAVDDASPSAHC